jgi:capsular exopolysaccharide synthesis family protein
MSRLYEALSRTAADQHRPGRVQPVVAVPDLVLPDRVAVDVVSPEPTKTAEGINGVTPEPAAVQPVVASEEARTVTVRASLESRLVALTESNGLGAEKFRVLVTRLGHLRKQRELQSLQITSSVVNEGKTLVAANLALTLAKYGGAKTLLIEGDLRRPTLAPLFGLDELQGLTHWWSSPNSDIADFCQGLKDMPLWLLPAGKACNQPSHILQSKRFSEAFARLATRFEWIVVDSTPMLPIVDVNLWSRLVNGTLLVVREGMTPVKALRRGLQALDQPKLIGVVVNEASEFDQVNYEGQYYQAPKHGAKPRYERWLRRR